jgi:6,7-dimethyl-8-ribityllumazine synthase
MVREGKLNAKGFRFAIVVSRFQQLHNGPPGRRRPRCVEEARGRREQDRHLRVPGSFEIPLAAKLLAKKKDIDAVVCLAPSSRERRLTSTTWRRK